MLPPSVLPVCDLDLSRVRTVTSAEDECRRQTDLREAAARELADLAVKYEVKQGAAADLETKVKVSTGSWELHDVQASTW